MDSPTPAIRPNRAVVDQVVDGATALLLVGPDEHPRHVPASDLPDGARDGTWLILDPDGVIQGIDEELTAGRRAAIHQRMERIRRERKGDRFNR